MVTPLPTVDPLCSLETDCLAFNVRKTARILARAFDEAYAPCGLKSTQIPLLVALHLSGPLQVGTLAEKLDMDRTTLPRNLGPLERRGLVQITEGVDRRTREIQITPAGDAVLRQAYPLWSALQGRLTATLGSERAERLRGDLHALANAVVSKGL